MPPTKRGIYHNLKESEYTVSNTEIVFFFSSKVYMDKFLKGYKNNRCSYLSKIDSLSGDIPLNMTTLADITFYKQIEKRGFRAWLKGVDIGWEDIHLYALRKMTLQNINDWCEIQKPKLEERIKIMV
jgi:Phi-29-like late genes activator (early protein GP4).